MNSDLEEIKSRLNIVDVLGEYIRLEKAGTNFRALCPFHHEKSPSFMVSEEKQIWHCFGCQKGGDVFSFVMEMEGMEFKEALKILADKAGVELKKYGRQDHDGPKSKTPEILELATKFYEIQLWQGAGKEKIVNYFKQRGFSESIMKEFRLGYAPKGWRNILNFLQKRGYKIEEIEKTGLLVKKEKTFSHPSSVEEGGGGGGAGSFSAPLRPALAGHFPSFEGQRTENVYDRFRDRIMFPIADSNSKVVGFSARVAPGGDESHAKYVNTPETESYHKSRVLYGIDKAKMEIKKQDNILLVEGNADAIACHQAGIKNAVAVSGTALTEDQIKIIKRYTNNLQMFFDMDAAGQMAAKKSAKLCFSRGLNVKAVQIPSGKDAADMAKENPEKLVEAVQAALPAMEYFFQRAFSQYDKRKVEDKKIIAKELLDIISSLSDEIEKSHWIKKLAGELEVGENVLTDMLKKATLVSRFSEKKEETKDLEIGAEGKAKILRESLLGLMLVYPEAWKIVLAEKDLPSVLSEDSLARNMLEKGLELNFNFDKLLNCLDEADKARAEKLYFEKKYRVGLNNEIEEVSVDDAGKETRQHFLEMRRELKKEELKNIARDLKSAREKGDKEAEMFLRQESKRISEEIKKLI